MNDDNELRDRLGRELHQRADGIHDAPLTLADVKGTAGSIRRTRRLATAAGVAAVVALIVPVAIFASQGLGQSDSLPPASNAQLPTPTRTADSSAPSPEPTPPTSAPSPGAVPGSALDGAFPTGPPPALPYLDGKQLISHDRAPVDLPQAYDSFTMVGDRFVGIYSDVNGERMVDIVEGDGSVSLTEPVEGGLALSDIGTTVAYGTPAGTIETVWADDQVQLANNLGEPVSVAAVVGNGSCHEVDGGCRVFFNSNTGGTPRAADSHGIVDEFMKGALKVNDISPTGLIAVMTSAADETSCSGVYNEQHQRFVFKTCDNTLQTFSPDGGRLLAGPDYLDGIGDGSLAILDTATGDPVAQFEIDGGYIAGAQWEDDDHALVIVHTDDVGWRILRVGVDGSVEMAAGPKVTVDDTQRPYFLPS